MFHKQNNQNQEFQATDSLLKEIYNEQSSQISKIVSELKIKQSETDSLVRRLEIFLDIHQ